MRRAAPRPNLIAKMFMAAIYVVVVALVSWWSYWDTKQIILTRIDPDLFLGATAAKYILPHDFHDRALTADAITAQEDWSNIHKLTQFARETDLKFVYTVIEQEGRVHITSSSATQEELAKQTEVHYFETYDEASAQIRQAFDQHQPIYTTYTDRWGMFRAAIVPERSPQGHVYLAVAEFEISYVKGALQRKLAQSILIALLLLAASTPMFLLYLKQERVHSEALEFDIENRKETEARLNKALDEKEILLRELYHRTRNNMQMINALLEMRLWDTTNDEVKQILNGTMSKIQAMALVHDTLYKVEDLSQIDIQVYINDLIQMTRSSYQLSLEQIQIQLDVESIPILIDTVMPLSLVLNELIINSLTHAFPENQRGVIRISLSKSGAGDIMLDYADNGIGVPPDFDFRTQSSLGLQNIIILVEHQLMGHIEFEANGGVVCRIRFRDDLYRRRV